MLRNSISSATAWRRATGCLVGGQRHNHCRGAVFGVGDFRFRYGDRQQRRTSNFGGHRRRRAGRLVELNEGSGSTANDSGGGTADNGSIANAAWVQSPASIDETNAMQLNGTSTVVNLGSPSKLGLTSQLTFAAWIDPANLNSEQFIINEGTTLGSDVFLMLQNGDYEIGSNSGSLQGTEYTIPASDLNTWVFLAGTYDGTTWRLYRDGQLVASSTGAGKTTPNNTWEIARNRQA